MEKKKNAKIIPFPALNRTLFIRDNLSLLRSFTDNSVDLIYLDPPFNSNKNYSAPIGSKAAGSHFKDMWHFSDTDDEWWGELADKNPNLYEIIHAVGCVNGNSHKSYLVYMAMRLIEMHRVLKDTGSIYLHCDQSMSHSLKLVMDAIFKRDYFINEIVWCYGLGGSSFRFFSRKHDNIFIYSKTKSYYFKKPMMPSTSLKMKGKLKGMVDYWMLPTINNMAKERTGYPTQKPLKLLERIIKASCPENGLILDPFCGCATACIAAEKLQRKWIGIDISPIAETLIKRRLVKELGKPKDIVTIRTDLPERNAPKPSPDIKYKLYGKQRGYCNLCEEHFKFRHFEIDHKIPKSKGGQDIDSNFQLLCGHCNRIKGNKTMPEARARLKEVS